MNINANMEIVTLTSTQNFTGSTQIHEVYCVADGSIKICAIAGGSATLTMVAGQKVDCVISQTTVNSGTFIGFRKAPTISYLTYIQ